MGCFKLSLAIPSTPSRYAHGDSCLKEKREKERYRQRVDVCECMVGRKREREKESGRVSSVSEKMERERG